MFFWDLNNQLFINHICVLLLLGGIDWFSSFQHNDFLKYRLQVEARFIRGESPLLAPEGYQGGFSGGIGMNVWYGWVSRFAVMVWAEAVRACVHVLHMGAWMPLYVV